MTKQKMTKALITKTLVEEYRVPESELKDLKLADLEKRLAGFYERDKAIALALNELETKYGYNPKELADNTLEELIEMIEAEEGKGTPPEPAIHAEPAADTPDAAVENDTPVENDAAPEAFVSMCMSDFDPSPEGTCHMQCNMTHTDAFNACQSHYLVMLADSARRRSGKNGKTNNGKGGTTTAKTARVPRAEKLVNFLGHGIATQVHLIDTALLLGSTIDEMADLCGTTKNRINAHLFTLRNKLGLNIRREDKTKRLYLILPDDKPLVPEEWLLVPEKWHPKS